MQKDDILVSCGVVSYNSEQTVIETLESIKSQTYANVELVISDDGSTDNTISLCRKWLAENGERFVRVEILTVPQNTGICANMNRLYKACKGTWLKCIAADDILLPNCVEDCVDYITQHPEVCWLSSYVRVYKGTFEENNYVHTIGTNREFFSYSYDNQLRILAVRNRFIAPAQFLKMSLIQAIGGYDEAYQFEDYSFYFTALEHGHRCCLLEKETVGYRIHDSISNSARRLYNYGFLLNVRDFQRKRCFQYLTKRQIHGCYIIWGFQDIIEHCHINKRNIVMTFIYDKFCTVINIIFRLGRSAISVM